MAARALNTISLTKSGVKRGAIISLLFAACAPTPTIVTHETSSSRETSINTAQSRDQTG